MCKSRIDIVGFYHISIIIIKYQYRTPIPHSVWVVQMFTCGYLNWTCRSLLPRSNVNLIESPWYPLPHRIYTVDPAEYSTTWTESGMLQDRPPMKMKTKVSAVDIWPRIHSIAFQTVAAHLYNDGRSKRKLPNLLCACAEPQVYQTDHKRRTSFTVLTSSVNKQQPLVRL